MEKNHEEGAAEIDLFQLLLALRKKIVVLLVAVIAGGLIAGIYTHFFITPVYSSTSMMLVLGNESSDSSLTDLQIGSQLTQDYSMLITSRTVLQEVIDNLGLDMNYKTLEGNISINNPEDTRVLEITVTNPDPEMAKKIVDELSEVSSEFIGEQMEVVPPKIVEEGEVPGSQTSPNMRRNVMMGALVGFALAAGVIILMTLMDDTLKTEDDIERYLGIPNLATVPDRKDYISESHSDSRKKKKRRKSR